MNVEWVPTAITAIGGLLTAAIPAALALRKQRNELKLQQEEAEQAKRALEAHRSVSGINLSVEAWGEVNLVISRLFHKGLCVRFLILRGWNGKENIKRATAIYQRRKDFNSVIDYIGYPISADGSYNQQLRLARREGITFIRIKDYPAEDELAILYNNEVPPIAEVAWFPVRYIKMEDGRAMIAYCSIGTEVEWTAHERHEIRLAVIAIQSLFGYDQA